MLELTSQRHYYSARKFTERRQLLQLWMCILTKFLNVWITRRDWDRIKERRSPHYRRPRQGTAGHWKKTFRVSRSQELRCWFYTSHNSHKGTLLQKLSDMTDGTLWHSIRNLLSSITPIGEPKDATSLDILGAISGWRPFYKISRTWSGAE